MKNRFLIPVMAMFLAIGMSFATESKAGDATTDYYEDGGSFMPLGKEINCGNGSDDCWVELPNGDIRQVYDAPDLDSPKIGDGSVHKF